MIWASLHPSSGARRLQWRPLVLLLERGGGSAVGRGRAGWPNRDWQRRCHRASAVGPEAAAAVVGLLVVGVGTPEACWTVHGHRVMDLRGCCIWLVDLFELFDDAQTCKL